MLEQSKRRTPDTAGTAATRRARAVSAERFPPLAHPQRGAESSVKFDVTRPRPPGG